MHGYLCHVCKGLCDAGELENGVCFDCRAKAVHRQEEKSLQTRKKLNQMIQAKYREQSDGQLVMNYGT